ncbi:MAG: ATP-dependent helicase [Candidatus Dormibacterales bacterium]
MRDRAPALNASAGSGPRALEALLDSLNPPQREAVEHGEGPLLVFAGAGSGKTRVLTARVANLVATGRAWPERILAVTFTNKAAREMRTRVASLLEGDAESMWVGTFHATAVRVLRREAAAARIDRNFVIFDDDDTRAALKRVLDDLGLDPRRFAPGGIAHRISQAKNELVAPEAYPADSYVEEVTRRAYLRYQELLERAGALDFDDLIGRLAALLGSDAEVLERWRDRFRHVLVDEYQDTNHAQYVLVSLLAGGHRNLAVVGDDDQSVYGWRGADVRNILDFQKDHPDAHVVRLEQNYRSTQPILDAAHAVIRHNQGRAEKRLWTQRPGGERVHALQAYNEVEEAEFVSDEIARLVRTEGLSHSDFAILYRTNAQSRAFEDVLNRRRIPYRLVGGVKFWERREVKDVMAYLRFVFNPRDTVSFERVVNVPRRKIGPRTVDALLAHARERDSDPLEAIARIEDAPQVPKAARSQLGRFRVQVESVRSVMGVLRPSELVDHLLEVMELARHYQDGTPQGDARLENLQEFRGLAAEFDDVDPAGALEGFLTEAALVSDVDAYDDRGPGVTLITLHMVKGLEFPVVFLAGMEEGLLPHQRSLDDPTGAGLEEERRLCYVGMTRAKDRLYLTCTFRRHLYGRSVPAMPSRFLADIPHSLLRSPRAGAAPAAPARDRGLRERMMARQVEAAPAPPPVQRFSEGDRVRHPAFGVGVVLKSTLTRTDEELMVRFEAGLKILSGSLAPLARLDT